MTISRFEAKKITCSNCNYSLDNKCPLGKSKDLCCPNFVMFLYNNEFTNHELMEIKTISNWREICKKDKSTSTQVEAFAAGISTHFLNKKLNNIKKVVLYAIADTFLKELMPELVSDKYVDVFLIKQVVSWYGAKHDINNEASLLNNIYSFIKEEESKKECFKNYTQQKIRQN